MKKGVVSLDVILAKQHISDFCITLPLCVVFTEKKLIPWYYENFTNICTTDRKKSVVL